MPEKEVLGDYFAFGTSTTGFIVGTLIAAVTIVTIVLLLQVFLPWIERKLMARMMNRIGPEYAGPFGVLQNLADTIKLLAKQDVIPKTADRFAFEFGVFLMVWSSIAATAPLHLSGTFVATRLNIGFLYIFGIFSLFAPASLIFGWGTNSKYSMIGGFRSAAQVIAYEIPMAISVVGVLVVSQSYRIFDIVEAQSRENGSLLEWFMFPQMLGFVVFFICAVAETERIPFDIPEAESELVMGLRTEMSGWRYAMALMVEYIHLFVNSALVIYFFLGGWHDPFPSSWIEARLTGLSLQFYQATWFLLKDLFILFLVTWMRVALPRFRIDQFLTFGWLTLLPLALINTVVAIALAITGLHNGLIGIIVGILTMILAPLLVAFAHSLRPRE